MSRGRYRDAFEAMTQPHLGSLYRVALRLTGQREAAEDLVQDTCLRAYRSFEAVAEVSNYKAWLLRIMTNRHIDNMRRKTELSCSAPDRVHIANRPDRIIADGAQDDFEDTGFPLSEPRSRAVDPETSVYNKAFLHFVLRAIDRLPSDVRAVVVLAIIEECRYDDIAQMLGCPMGTVRSRLSRGRQLLQAALADYRPSGMSRPYRPDAKTVDVLGEDQ